MSYPRYRKWIDKIVSRRWPEYSERQFIKLMGWQWFVFYGFRHQVSLGAYRPDFVSQKYKLIIEVEGKTKYRSGDIVRDWEYREYQQRRHRFARLGQAARRQRVGGERPGDGGQRGTEASGHV